MTEFHANLRAAGVSLPFLAASTGRPLGTVRRWVDGTATPPPEVLAWLARRLADPPPAVAPRRPVPPVRKLKGD